MMHGDLIKSPKRKARSVTSRYDVLGQVDMNSPSDDGVKPEDIMIARVRDPNLQSSGIEGDIDLIWGSP